MCLGLPSILSTPKGCFASTNFPQRNVNGLLMQTGNSTKIGLHDDNGHVLSNPRRRTHRPALWVSQNLRPRGNQGPRVARPGHIVRPCPRRLSTAPSTRSQGIERGDRRGCWQDRNAHGMRSPAVVKLLVGLLSSLLLLCIAPTAKAAPLWNVGYRTIAVQDALTGESFPVALWYPTPAAPAPLFVTGSLSLCQSPAILCRGIAYEMPVAENAPVSAGAFGMIVVSHGAGGMALLHRDLAMALASQGYVVAAPTHPRGKGNDISGVAVWVG